MTAPRYRLVKGAGMGQKPRDSYDVVVDTETNMSFPFPAGGFAAKALEWLIAGYVDEDYFNGYPSDPYELQQIPAPAPAPAPATTAGDATIVRFYVQLDHEGDLCILDRLSDRVILCRGYSALNVIDGLNDGTRDHREFPGVSRRFFESPEYRATGSKTRIPKEDRR